MAIAAKMGNAETVPTSIGYPLFKPDHSRAIDRVIDYFGSWGRRDQGQRRCDAYPREEKGRRRTS